jgi:hypothetical protein
MKKLCGHTSLQKFISYIFQIIIFKFLSLYKCRQAFHNLLGGDFEFIKRGMLGHIGTEPPIFVECPKGFCYKKWVSFKSQNVVQKSSRF